MGRQGGPPWEGREILGLLQVGGAVAVVVVEESMGRQGGLPLLHFIHPSYLPRLPYLRG